MWKIENRYSTVADIIHIPSRFMQSLFNFSYIFSLGVFAKRKNFMDYGKLICENRTMGR